MRTVLGILLVTLSCADGLRAAEPTRSDEPMKPFQLSDFISADELATLTKGADDSLPSEKWKEALLEQLNADGTWLSRNYACDFCHGDPEFFRGDQAHLYIPEESLHADVHWRKGIRCHECHGGAPDLRKHKEHSTNPDFQSLDSPADVPALCGRCHSDKEYMRHYDPGDRTDQVAEYWTSGHGRRLHELQEAGRADEAQVAICADCHSRNKKHAILAVDDPRSPSYPSNVAKTCGKCHSDAELMAGRTYNNRPLGHDQFDEWSKSVHAKAMDRGDLNAPTCNDCHGNHAAMPPGVESVANVCGTCHKKVAELFAETKMCHRFEEVGLPGCGACHGNHNLRPPGEDDRFLGMGEGAVCVKCHQENDVKHGATLAGANTARKMREALEKLKKEMIEAEELVAEAERLGMSVHRSKSGLISANTALTNARVLVHSFSVERVEEALVEGTKAIEGVKANARAAKAERTHRRIWLAVFVALIMLATAVLLFYIRPLPIPPKAEQPE